MSRFLAIAVLLILFLPVHAQKVDKKTLVLKHNIVQTKADTLSSITLGNGRFAFTTDITGLQTFCSNYQKGVPLVTQSEWAWRNANPLQLGNLGFEIVKKDGTLAMLSDVQSIYQELNFWTGKLRSHFTIEGIPVEVATYSSGTDEAIGVKVRSPLITEGRLKLRLVFPFPVQSSAVVNSAIDDKHESKILMSHDNGAVVSHQFDTMKYYIGFKWEVNGSIEQKNVHYYLIAPDTKTDLFQLTAKFTAKKALGFLPTFIDVRTSSENLWKQFWNNNNAFNSTDTRANKKNEQVEKIVLSQYLSKTHEHLHKRD